MKYLITMSILFSLFCNKPVFSDYFTQIILPFPASDIVKTDDDKLFILSGNDVYTNTGISWFKVFNSSDYSDDFRNSEIQIIDNVLFLRLSIYDVFPPRSIMFVSNDRGQHWQSVLSGTSYRISNIVKINNRLLTSAHNESNLIFYNSIDGGFNWIEISRKQIEFPRSDIVQLHDTLFFLHNSVDYYKSENYGVSWNLWRLPLSEGDTVDLFSNSEVLRLSFRQYDGIVSHYEMEELNKWRLIRSFSPENAFTFLNSIDSKFYYSRQKENVAQLCDEQNGDIQVKALFPYCLGCSKPLAYLDSILICSNDDLYISTDSPEGFCQVVFDKPETSHFLPEDIFFLNTHVYNKLNEELNQATLYIILEAYGHYFFGPNWHESEGGYYRKFKVGENEEEGVKDFGWPEETGMGNATFIAFVYKNDLYSNIEMWPFSWGY